MSKARELKSAIYKDSMLSKKSTKRKTPTLFQTYDVLTWRQQPVSIAWLENLAAEEINWAMDEKNNATVWEEFLILKGLSKAFYYKSLERCEKLREAHEFSLMVLGVRRHKGALENKYNAGLFKYSQRLYDPDWKKLDEEWSSILQKAQNLSGNLIVEMPSIPSSELVPLKKD